MVDWNGIVWKVQLAVFVFVSVSTGSRLVEGTLALDTLAGVGNVVLLLIAAAGAVAVAVTREPISRLLGRPDTGE